MSADYYIYTDHIDTFDPADFSAWAAGLGYDIELPPDFSIREIGFVPIRFRAEFLGEGSWRTGFELFSDSNEYEPQKPVLQIPEQPRKQGLLAKLFGRKQPAVKTPAEILSMPLDVPDHAGSEKKWVITCSCRWTDPLEQLAAYLLAGYFCEKFGAVIDDPQTGSVYEAPNEIKQEFQSIITEMMDNYQSWGLEFIPFKGWNDVT